MSDKHPAFDGYQSKGQMAEVLTLSDMARYGFDVYQEPILPGKKWCGRNHGPSVGYGSEEKKIWRDAMWSRICARDRWSGYSTGGDVLGPVARKDKTVFMLESLDGMEIQKCLKLGFSESNLHVCNANPAVVAVLKRRFPAINTYGVPAERALYRIAKAGIKLSVISLDFCACLSSSVLDSLRATRSAAYPLCLIAVNVLRGREPQGVRDVMKGLQDWRQVRPLGRTAKGAYHHSSWKSLRGLDYWRHLMMACAFGHPPPETHRRYPFCLTLAGRLWWAKGQGPQRRYFVDSCGTYKSSISNQTMGWTLFVTAQYLKGWTMGERAVIGDDEVDSIQPKRRVPPRQALGFRN
jgi:hypothetical protein